MGPSGFLPKRSGRISRGRRRAWARAAARAAEGNDSPAPRLPQRMATLGMKEGVGETGLKEESKAGMCVSGS